MTETQEPTQEQIDSIVEKRLARARRQWREEQEQRDRAWFKRLAEKDARHMLESLGVTDPGRQNRIMKFVDMDSVSPLDNGDPDIHTLDQQFKEIRGDIPELFPSSVGERALDTSTREEVQGLTLEAVQKMSPEEVNARWDEVQKFLSGTGDAGSPVSEDVTTRQVGE
jgi:hypothetical protein